jgi:ssDNA-binding Zn-finger/Zn-ribbon topoisomerase 1
LAAEVQMVLIEFEPVDEAFDHLVQNGFDFLQHGIDEIHAEPKYSVIHFCAGVEILLKARLVAKDWRLIVVKPKDIGHEEFLNGEFKSLYRGQSLAALKCFTDNALLEALSKSLEKLSVCRNKLMHFYDLAHQRQDTASVAAYQCSVWQYTHRLLAEEWRDTFWEYQNEVQELDRQMLLLRQYLEVKYENLLPEIERDTSQGVHFDQCPACGFSAFEFSEHIGPLLINRCRVCEYETRLLELTCPSCGCRVQTYDPVAFECPECGISLEMDQLIDLISNQGRLEVLERGEPGNAYCLNCEWTAEPSVIRADNRWICLSCLTDYVTVGTCDWCGTLVAGDTSDSYVYGCAVCDGRFGDEAP